MLANVFRKKMAFGITKTANYHKVFTLSSYPMRTVKTFYPQYGGAVDERAPKVILTSKRLGSMDGRKLKVRLRFPKVKSQTLRQPPLRHDFIDFKSMSGNEILLNLENSQYLRNGELINALLELGKRPGQEKFDWEVHPYTKLALDQIRKRMAMFNKMHISQVALMLDRINYNNNDLWHSLSGEILKMIHLFSGKQLANFLDLYVPALEDSLEDDDVVYLDKEIAKKQKQERCSNEFLERILRVFPIHVKDLSINKLVRVSEV
jgi:hypothetical protein